MAMFLVTNNGTHPPEKWAMLIAETIFDLSETSMSGESLLKAQKMRVLIAECLVPHCTNTQNHEKDNLVKAKEHALSPHEVDIYVNNAMNDIVAASKATPWENHFANVDVQHAAKFIIKQNFITIQHIERLWFADKNQGNVAAQTYKAKFHG